MVLKLWRAGARGNFADPSRYTDGVLPATGDTVLVSTVSGAAPYDNGSEYALLGSPGDSEVSFASPSAQAPSVIADLTPQPTIAAERAFPGAAVGNQDLVFSAGAGMASGAGLLLTTLSAASTVQVVGTAVFDLDYDNTLAGTIDVGAPAGQPGIPSPPPTPNSHGLTNELDLYVRGYGSTDVDPQGNDLLRNYRPATTNLGTIDVASASALRIGFYAGARTGGYIRQSDGSYRFVSIFPGAATFGNKGVLDIAPGASLGVYDGADALGYQPNAVFDGFFSQFVNDGQVNVRGASGVSTSALFQGFVTGSGTIAVDGGDATDQSQTVLRLEGVVYNQNITVRNGTVQAFDHDYDFNRVIGGNLTFLDGRGVLDISADGQSSAPFNSGATNALLPGFSFSTPSIQLPFGATIQGFQAGDHIVLEGLSDLQDFGQRYYLSWNQQAQVLSVLLSPQVLGGVPSSQPTLVAQFLVAGTFQAGQFDVAFTPAAKQGGSAVSGTLDITTSAPGSPQADPLFDPAYYLAQNPDVAAAGVDPYRHYMTTGWKEGRNPDAYFDTRYYLSSNPDVAAAGVNPLAHFEQYGWKEGRQPSLAFSDSAYLAAYPDVASAGVDPLAHFLQTGRSEGRQSFLTGYDGASGAADPLVDASFYDRQLGATIVPPGIAGQAQAAELYRSTGWRAGLDPDAWFDGNYYLARNPDVKAAGVDPLAHFETFGWKEGREPSLVFSDAKYLAANPDVAAAGVDPLSHYLQFGQSEGRMAFLPGGAAPADPLVDAAYYDRQLGAGLLPSGQAAEQQAAFSYDATGWRQGLNPDTWFDTNYYLARNPDVAAAHVDPLLHYETYGWKEGRDPSAGFSTAKYLAAYTDVRAAGIDPLLHYVVFGQAEGRAAIPV